VVFIGRNLEGDVLEQGLAACQTPALAPSGDRRG
jgi:hypothetical protein